MLKVIIFFLVFLTTFFGVEIFRRWSLKKELFDIPNERSSHTQPTPRGGGLVIVIVTLLSYITYLQYFSIDISWYFLIGAILITLISGLDDLFSIAFGWRFLIHLVAAIIAIWGIGFWDSIYIPIFGNLRLGYFGAFITFCWIVWLTNAFNFMDGIDGIAGIQALTAGLGWFFVSYILGIENVGMLGGFIAFSSFAFLMYNWQPAKIFMGDVCSAFLGYTFAVIPLLAKDEITKEKKSILPTIAILFVWFFVFDSLYTFTKRLMRGEKVWQAHREHIYQSLVIKGYSHQTVSILYGLISSIVLGLLMFWLKFRSVYEVILVFTTILLSTFILFMVYVRSDKV